MQNTVLEFSRETEPIIYIKRFYIKKKRFYILIYKEIYYEGLALGIMVAEKSRDLLSISWRPKKASGVVLVPTQRPEKN